MYINTLEAYFSHLQCDVDTAAVAYSYVYFEKLALMVSFACLSYLVNCKRLL